MLRRRRCRRFRHRGGGAEREVSLLCLSTAEALRRDAPAVLVCAEPRHRLRDLLQPALHPRLELQLLVWRELVDGERLARLDPDLGARIGTSKCVRMMASEKSVSLRNTLPMPSGFAPFQPGPAIM